MMRKVIIIILLFSALSYGDDNRFLLLSYKGNTVTKEIKDKNIYVYATDKGSCLQLFIYPDLLIKADQDSIFYVDKKDGKIKLIKGRFYIETGKKRTVFTSLGSFPIEKGKVVVEVKGEKLFVYTEKELPSSLKYLLRASWCYNKSIDKKISRTLLPVSSLKPIYIKRRRSLTGESSSGSNINISVQSSCLDTASSGAVMDPTISGSTTLDPSVRHNK